MAIHQREFITLVLGQFFLSLSVYLWEPLNLNLD